VHVERERERERERTKNGREKWIQRKKLHDRKATTHTQKHNKCIGIEWG